MKSLERFIKEELNLQTAQWKIDRWLGDRKEERQAWENACKQWAETHQFDDSALQAYMDKYDYRGMVDFLMDDASTGVTTHEDDFNILKNVIKNSF